jgi:hypothetical protein
MIGSSLPLCYPQIAVSDLLSHRALCFISPLTKHIRLVGLLPRLGGDSVRVFKHFPGLGVDSDKMALSRPAPPDRACRDHQYPVGA